MAQGSGGRGDVAATVGPMGDGEAPSLSLDDRMVIDTPEGVDLALVVAGLGSRGAALLIDYLAIGVGVGAAFLVAIFAADFSEGLATAVVSLALFVALLGYFPLLETFWNGQTLGKRALGLRVTTLEGGRAPFWRVIVREVLRLIDILPTVYLVGATSIVVSDHNQRVGDLAAGTLVVRVRQRG